MNKTFRGGKIYKLINDDSDIIYIGSTTQKLHERLSQHKYFYNKNKNSNKNYTSMELFRISNNVRIELIEEIICTSKKELEKKEKEYIIKYFNICVNKKIPTRTDSEYYRDNAERIKEKDKNYRENNKDKIRIKKKNYQEKNRDIIREKKRKYYLENRERILQQQKKYDKKK